MLHQDLINRVVTAHDSAVSAALKYSYAAAKGGSVTTLYARFERAEARFDAAMAALVQNK